MMELMSSSHTAHVAEWSARRVSPPAIAALAELYRSEARLLADLTRVLQAQFTALDKDELDVVDDTVFATHRILGTLGEARRRRREVHLLLAGVEELDTEAIDKLLGGEPPEELREARAVLRTAATQLSAQVRLSRTRLEDAVANGEALIRSVYGGGDSVSAQHPFESARTDQRGGILLNRTA